MDTRQAMKTEFSDRDKVLIATLLRKVAQARLQNDRIALVARSELKNILENEELAQIDKVYAIDPTRYGFKGPRQGIETMPKNLIRVAPRPYHFEGKKLFTATQYVPERTHCAFRLMAGAMQQQIGRTILVESSYRSNDFQAIVFLGILQMNDFSLMPTIQRAAIPGYSEHTTPSSLALDVQNVDGLPSDKTPQDFEGTQEYDWLVENAQLYDFFMSYPRDNPYGLMFEPWHWRHIPR